MASKHLQETIPMQGVKRCERIAKQSHRNKSSVPTLANIANIANSKGSMMSKESRPASGGVLRKL